MKKTLTTNEIAKELLNDSNAKWSSRGAFALADWLENYETEICEELELDVVAIRCDFSEYDSAQEAAENHGWEPSGDIEEDGPECDAEALQWLETRTIVIEFEGGLIIQDF